MSPRRGVVFNIQRFSTHDGPGLRTTVFFKGCPLRCPWCHNPESQAFGSELMISRGRCIQCGSCLAVCPTGAASGDAGLCSHCGRCAEACPSAAREVAGREMAVDDVVDEISRDRVFYEESGGGVTFSGGEPLAQPEFLLSCLEACRALGLHAAIDTCGFAPREIVVAAAALSDLVLFDLKAVDPGVHERLTGASNSPILQNLRALAGGRPELWVRIPVVPGVNDDLESMAFWAALAGSLKGVRRVSLLPYHRLGEEKAARLARDVVFRPGAAPDAQSLAGLAEPFRRAGLAVTIGG